jgi:hypothetical protein
MKQFTNILVNNLKQTMKMLWIFFLKDFPIKRLG